MGETKHECYTIKSEEDIEMPSYVAYASECAAKKETTTPWGWDEYVTTWKQIRNEMSQREQCDCPMPVVLLEMPPFIEYVELYDHKVTSVGEMKKDWLDVKKKMDEQNEKHVLYEIPAFAYYYHMFPVNKFNRKLCDVLRKQWCKLHKQ